MRNPCVAELQESLKIAWQVLCARLHGSISIAEQVLCLCQQLEQYEFPIEKQENDEI